MSTSSLNWWTSCTFLWVSKPHAEVLVLFITLTHSVIIYFCMVLIRESPSPRVYLCLTAAMDLLGSLVRFSHCCPVSCIHPGSRDAWQEHLQQPELSRKMGCYWPVPDRSSWKSARPKLQGSTSSVHHFGCSVALNTHKITSFQDPTKNIVLEHQLLLM